jgi:hypothetical protein
MFEVIKPSKALVDTRKLQSDLVKAMEDTVQDGVTFMREYPPQTLTQTGYVRTGTLMRSWSKSVKVGTDRIEGTIGSSGNMAPYNKYVEGPEATQSHMMAGAGWQSIEKLIARIVEPKLKERLDKIFGSLK